MKKTLLALAVLTAAGSANAGINLYDEKGVKVDLSGAAEIQYMQDYDAYNDAELRIDDADIGLSTTVAISDQLNAVAGMGFEFEDGNVNNDELWAGFSSNQFGTITFGRQYMISDDSGIGKDYELGSESINFVQTNGNQVIKYVYDNGSFYFGASHDLNDSGESSDDNGNVVFVKDAKITDGRIGFRTAGIDARLYVYNGKNVDSANAQQDVKGYNLEAEYTLGNIGLAASFGQVDYTDNAGVKTEGNVYQIAADYTVEATTFAIGYNNYDVKKGDTADAYAVYANVTQQLHSNVNVYAEIGHTNADFDKIGNATVPKKNADFGYLAGLEVTF